MNVNKKYILYIVFIIFISCLFGCQKNNNSNTNESNNKPNISDIKKMEVDSETLNGLLDKIPYKITSLGLYNDAYNGSLVKFENLKEIIIYNASVDKYKDSYSMKNGNDEKIKQLLKKRNVERGVVYYISDINQYLLNNYNNTIESVSSNDSVIILNDEYVTFIFNNNKPITATAITLNTDVKKEADDIIVIEKKLFAIEEGKKCTIYKNSNIKGNSFFKEINKCDVKIIKGQLKEEDYTIFKHIFKQNEYGYYWYSTEVVE